VHRVPQKFLLLTFLLLGAKLPALYGAPVWPLLSDVRVAGNAIYLSDLLPPEASAEFRSLAASIRLGPAPSAGTSMTLTGEKIEAMIPRSARMSVVLPAEIVVRRAARLVTRDEVLAALNAALQSNSFPGNPRVDPEQVHYSADVKIAADDARLRVRRVDFDSALQQARFLLVPAADPRALPFVVTAHLTTDPTGEGATSPAGLRLLLASGQRDPMRTGSSGANADALIVSGQPVRLHVLSGNMQMFLDVVALEPGALHQVVRVRVPGSNRILRGQIIAAGSLEAQF
jgi:hypothetical protein